MIDRALAACDAYTSRTKGPPGRAEVAALTDRLRALECAVGVIADIPVFGSVASVVVLVILAALGGWLLHG